MDVFTVRVGFTITRPVVPDECFTFVIVAAKNENEAKLDAALMAGILGACPFGCCAAEMPTSTEIVSVEI